MNNKDYFDRFEQEHGRMPTFEEFCRDCPPKATYMNNVITDLERKPSWFTRLLIKLKIVKTNEK